MAGSSLELLNNPLQHLSKRIMSGAKPVQHVKRNSVKPCIGCGKQALNSFFLHNLRGNTVCIFLQRSLTFLVCIVESSPENRDFVVKIQGPDTDLRPVDSSITETTELSNNDHGGKTLCVLLECN